MIAKRIQRKRTEDTFKRLAAYVVNEKSGGKADPTQWELGEYVLDMAHEGEKVAYWRVTNCDAEEPGWAVKEIMATQAKNVRAKGDKSYHLVISFPPGERPTREQIEDIEDQAVKAIGLAEHQRISAVHQNTDNWHLHVAINKVHPRTHRNVEPYYDHLKLQEVCAELEIKHGLQRDNHTPKPEKPLDGKPAEMEAHAGRVSFHRWLIENAKAALVKGVADSVSWQEFHRVVARYGATIKPRGAGLVIQHRDNPKIRVKASAIDRSLSFKALTDRWGSYEPPQQRTSESEISERSGTAGNPGDGDRPPSITEDGINVEVPSAVRVTKTKPPIAEDRPAEDDRELPAMVYDAAPVHRDQWTQSLWICYQRERKAAEHAREETLAKLQAGHAAYRQEVAAWYRQRFKATRAAQLGRADRIASYRYLRTQQQKERQERRVAEANERKTVRKDHPIPTWQGFLEDEVQRGNTTALAVLRSRAERRARIEAAILTAADASEAQHVVHKRLKPIIRRDGTMIYLTADGGMVHDGAGDVAVTKPSAAAAYLALELAAQRFPGKQLAVHGDEAFRHTLAKVASIEGVSVQFADNALESLRMRHRYSVESETRKAHRISAEAEIGVPSRNDARNGGRA